MATSDLNLPQRLEDHLPRGFGLQFVLGVMAVGVLVTVAYAIYSYLDHLISG